MYILSSSVIEGIAGGMIMCATLLAISTPIMYAGWKNKQRFNQVREARSNKDDNDDSVVVSGSIKRASNEVMSPFRSEDCSIAMWDVSNLTRTAASGSEAAWSQELIGVKSNEVVVDDNGKEVKIKPFSEERLLGAGDQAKRALVKDTTSRFSSVEQAINSDSFERIFEPIDTLRSPYRRFTNSKNIDRVSVNSYDLSTKVMSRIRTPTDSIRYREKTFQVGDHLTIIGRETNSGVSFEETDLVSPLISGKPISKILRKYKLAYTLQLYCIPAICVLFSSLLGYGAYI